MRAPTGLEREVELFSDALRALAPAMTSRDEAILLGLARPTLEGEVVAGA